MQKYTLSTWIKKNSQILKKLGLFLAVWIVAYFIVDVISDTRYSDTIMIQSLALALLVVYVWGKIAKKYL